METHNFSQSNVHFRTGWCYTYDEHKSTLKLLMTFSFSFSFHSSLEYLTCKSMIEHIEERILAVYYDALLRSFVLSTITSRSTYFRNCEASKRMKVFKLVNDVITCVCKRTAQNTRFE